MTPDSLEWWQDQATTMREQFRDDPSPDMCCLYALTVGRCRLLGKNLKWPFPLKRALSAADSFITMISDYRSRLMDLPWLTNIWPEKIPEITPALLNRRIDVLGVQVMLDAAFSEVEVRYEEIVNEATDNVVNALLELDIVLEKTLPAMRKHGKADSVLNYHRSRIVKDFHDQWWLSEGKTKNSKDKAN